MKKITLVFLLLCIQYIGYSQVLDESSNWPNTNWTVTGDYDDAYLYEDPTTSTSFSFDDDDAGFGSNNTVAAESPVIDLTTAFNAGETWIFVDYTYVFNAVSSDLISFEYWDADAASWISWEQLNEDTPSAPFSDYCSGTSVDNTTTALNIAGFTTTQLSGFKYRVAYDDNDAWAWGFCISDLTIYSQTPPTCPDPSALVVASTDVTSAMLSWTESGTADSWMVEYDVTGFTQGTGETVTADTNTNFEISDLIANTSYDFYVKAICSDTDESEWVGPVSFETLVQTEFSVDCAVGPTNFTYCYENNDTNVFHFQGTEDYPLTMAVISGGVENNFDEFIVYDSNGTTELYNGYGNAGDLSGLTFTASDNEIYIAVTSDGSVNCQSSANIASLNINVYCLDCTPAEVTFDVEQDCTVANLDEFNALVTVTDMGDATSLTITDDQGTTALEVTEAGAYSYGSYTFGTNVMVTVENTDNANCTETSDPLTNYQCPPDFDALCNTINAGEDVTVDCGDEATDLTADYIVTGSNTSSYTLTEISCDPEIEDGTSANLIIDDRYSEAIDIGFDFCFFGNTYDQLVVGANGLVSFNMNYADAYCPYSFDETAPDPGLPLNAIYGVYHDIDPSDDDGCTNEITYVISGTAPNRTFTVNFNDICQYGSSCNGLASTTQIILYEATNAIEINIIDKPLCTAWNSGNALAGLQNADGTIAFTPPNRNTGAWEASDESWRYVPSGPANYTFEWLEGDTVLSSDDTISVAPSETTTYTAQVTYEQCDGTFATVTDDVTITVENSNVMAGQPDDLSGCDDISNDGFLEFDLTQQDEAIIDGQEGVTVSYYATIEDAQDEINPLVATAYTNTVAYTQTIYASLEDTATGCSDIVSFDLIVYDRPIVTYGHDYEVCSNGSDPVVLDGNPIDFDPAASDITIAWYQDGELMAGETSVDLEVYDAGTYVIEVSNENCNFSRTIEVAESGDCIIPQGISPQGDQYNQNFDLDGFNFTQLKIFNRLGKEVYSKADYTDEWHGQDKNGNELPVGTYYYVLTRQDGSNVTGWVYVNY